MLCSFFIEIVLLNRDLEVKELLYELAAAWPYLKLLQVKLFII